MKSWMMMLLAVAVMFLSAAPAIGEISVSDREAVEGWVRTLADLKGTDVPLATTQNNLPVVFNLRDVAALERLNAQKNDYLFNAFMIAGRRGMVIPPGVSGFVEDFVTFETNKKIHVFVKIRVTEFPTAVWTTLADLEHAVWGEPAP